MSWLIGNKEINYKVIDIDTPVIRFSDYLYGTDYGLHRKDLQKDFIISDHFGINQSTDIYPSESNKYLIISRFDYIAYAVIYKDINRFNEDDFRKIDNCININKIYNNGEVKINYITASQS
ncbi:MAG: hypothetical protein NC238_15985 [Dehalobacter sp.]|nr:hypothetical protein [Dehalobacter sp.]